MPSLPSTLSSALLLLNTSLSAALPSAPIKRSGPTCTEVVLPVTISANNLVIPDSLVSGLTSATPLSLTGAETLINSVGNTLQSALVNGTWNIAGRFCEPEVQIAGRESAVQLLVHGIASDRNYWSGGSQGSDIYSWISYASQQGYSTLAIDRLGNGESDHPDPITVVQKPAHVEVAHQVIQALRDGKVGGRAFDKVSYVGHSFGSIIGNSLAARYPNDVDALILSGYTSNVKPAIPGILITSVTLPASLAYPAKFSSLSVGYTAFSQETGVRGMLYTNTKSEWDAGVAHAEWLARGTYTVGESISTVFANDVATAFTKPVLILTGHKDQIFCGLALPLLGEASCGGSGSASNYIQLTKRLFPNAQFSTKEIPNTGHHLNFHYSANVTFAAAHDFLEGAGL